MPTYLCRWSNGDVSLAAGESELEVADVLDEVDNPDAAELMQLDHAIAVHFKLGTRPGEEGTLPLRFEDMSEQLESSIYERAYPVYNEVHMRPDSTVKELTEALKHEKNPIYRRAPEPSSNRRLRTFKMNCKCPELCSNTWLGARRQPQGSKGRCRPRTSRRWCATPFTAWTGLLPGSLNHLDRWFPSKNGLRLAPS